MSPAPIAARRRKHALRSLGLLGLLATLVGCARPDGDMPSRTLRVGPFVVEAVDRRIGAGGFPNTSGNPFQSTTVTGFRVRHGSSAVGVPGVRDGGAAPWIDVRVLTDAPRPALLLLEHGAWLLTDVEGRATIEELAPRDTGWTEWQWLDSEQGQPGPSHVVGPAHRPGPPASLAGGRHLSVYSRAVVDVRTLAVHRYWLRATGVSEQLQGFYPSNGPAVAFSPGATQLVLPAERQRADGATGGAMFEHALVAWDPAARRGTVLPIDRAAWSLPEAAALDAAFARRALVWRRTPDGREQATLSNDRAPPR